MPRTGSEVEWEGERESVILTRRRGDAETSAEKRRSQEKTSAETAEDGGLRFGADALFGEQLAEKQRESQDRGGMGGETRECDSDAEALRRGDKRGEAAKSREDERGDSGGWWPSVRSGRAFRRATSGEAAGKSRPWWNGRGNERV